MNISLNLLLASGSLSFLLVASIKHFLSRFLLDIPNHRSSHTQPTPRGGGLGFVVAFALTSAIVSWLNWRSSTASDVILIWAVLTPLVIVGIFDDRIDVPARVRYIVQLIAASVAVFAFGAFPQPWFNSFGITGSAIAVLLTIVGMTAMINFYNFMDGLDGLVAGVSAVQLTYLAIALNQPIFLLLVVALLGFLCWNWSPAKIFMGDVGSTVLGATLAIALLKSGDPIQAWSSLAITLPLIADAIYTLIRRLIHKENIFQPHRTHLYQRLQKSGWSHAQVASSYILVTVAIALNLQFFHAVGAVISFLEVVCAIALGERYLSHQQGTRMRTLLYTSVRSLIAGLRPG